MQLAVEVEALRALRDQADRSVHKVAVEEAEYEPSIASHGRVHGMATQPVAQ